MLRGLNVNVAQYLLTILLLCCEICLSVKACVKDRLSDKVALLSVIVACIYCEML